MNPQPIEQAGNPPLGAELLALRRTEEIAVATNATLVPVIDWKVVRVKSKRLTGGKVNGPK
jgi:hypothetical protein